MAFTPAPKDHLGVKGPLKFDGTHFMLSWTDHPRENYFIQEYLPAGEKTETYHQMMTLHLFLVDIQSADAAAQKVKELTERKKTDPVCQFAVIKGPEGREHIVDFLLSESKQDKVSIVEFNIYRYVPVKTTKGNGMLVYAYTRRSYDDEIDVFLNTLSDTRKKGIALMANASVPLISLP